VVVGVAAMSAGAGLLVGLVVVVVGFGTVVVVVVAPFTTVGVRRARRDRGLPSCPS